VERGGRHVGYGATMTTTPNEPVENPQVVPSGDPSIQPDQNPPGPNAPETEPQGVPDGS